METPQVVRATMCHCEVKSCRRVFRSTNGQKQKICPTCERLIRLNLLEHVES